jgi:hypothetical protein
MRIDVDLNPVSEPISGLPAKWQPIGASCFIKKLSMRRMSGQEEFAQINVNVGGFKT